MAEKEKTSKVKSFFSRIFAWFRSVKAEMKKIVWTSPKALRANTVMVIVALVIAAAATGVIDFVFSKFIIILGILI
ncbi:MAG: preprotein translocase subunit SecE [Ruminococcaceae bacterium]|nr:preprotein translocase subunit SecE [Oscillospiraceae bacterium]